MSPELYGKIKVQVGGLVHDREYETYRYERRSDGWYVNFGDGRGFQKFAVKQADEIAVRQLIRKERSCLY